MTSAPTILMIGPICVGKSTISALLAEKLAIPHYAVDEQRWDLYKEIGYSEDEASRIAHSEGILGVLHYWKPFEVHAVERVLSSQSGCVIDFGAGHSVYEDPALFERVQAAFTPHPHVVLLLPSPDVDESIRVANARFADLLQREVGTVNPDLLTLNAHFVRHPSNRLLAKTVIYTEGKTLEAIRDEVIAWVTRTPPL